VLKSSPGGFGCSTILVGKASPAHFLKLLVLPHLSCASQQREGSLADGTTPAAPELGPSSTPGIPSAVLCTLAGSSSTGF